MSLNRREFMTGLAGSVAAGSIAAAQVRGSRPNILFILADDLGYGDVGVFGQKVVPTPNIDKIAAEGVRFTQSYAGCTVCAPSRCCLMTGYHTGHARIRGNAKVPLEASDTTVAKVLKQAGYRTGIVGKWGLGGAYTDGIPNLQGFDDWFGFLDQTYAHTYYPDSLWDNKEEKIIQRTWVSGSSGCRTSLPSARCSFWTARRRIRSSCTWPTPARTPTTSWDVTSATAWKCPTTSRSRASPGRRWRKISPRW
jgi:arylsulfatase A-like enzyme